MRQQHANNDLQPHVSGPSRRERQMVEIFLRYVKGDGCRAFALATEHVREFPDDERALAIVKHLETDERDRVIDEHDEVAT